MSDKITRIVTESQIDDFISRCIWAGPVEQWQRDGVRKILQDMPDAQPMPYRTYETKCLKYFSVKPCGYSVKYKKIHYTAEEFARLGSELGRPKLRLVVDNTKPTTSV